MQVQTSIMASCPYHIAPRFQSLGFVTVKILLMHGEIIVMFIRPRRCFAWRGFLLCVCLSVYVCVCPLPKYLKKF